MMDAVTQAVLARQPEYPPEQSMSGQNTYTIGCQVMGYSPGYCVCLHKIEAHTRDGDLKQYPECARAISNGSCPAIALRDQEREAGKALYFVHRELLREEMDKHLAVLHPAAFKSKPSAPKASPARTSPAPTPKKPATPTVNLDEENGYAAAINAAMREAEKPTEQPKQEEDSATSPSPAKRGPSMLELARMRMGKTSQGA